MTPCSTYSLAEETRIVLRRIRLERHTSVLESRRKRDLLERVHDLVGRVELGAHFLDFGRRHELLVDRKDLFEPQNLTRLERRLRIVRDQLTNLRCVHVRQQQLLVDTTRTDQCRIEFLRMVRRHDDDASRAVDHAVEDVQQSSEVQRRGFPVVVHDHLEQHLHELLLLRRWLRGRRQSRASRVVVVVVSVPVAGRRLRDLGEDLVGHAWRETDRIALAVGCVRGVRRAFVDDRRRTVNIFHDKDHVLERIFDRRVEPVDRKREVKDRVHEFLVRLDLAEVDGHNVALRVVCNGFDERGLARAGRTVEQKPELVRKTLDAKLARLGRKVVEQRQHLVLLIKKQVLKGLVLAQGVPFVGQYGLGLVVLRKFFCAGLNVKVARVVLFELGALARLVGCKRPRNQRFNTCRDGIEFRHTDNSNKPEEDKAARSNVTEATVKFEFRSPLKDGTKRIDALVEKAFSKYQEKQLAKTKSDQSRYFCIQTGATSAPGESSQQVVAYKRYALSEEKTFDNLFFDDKPQVLSLLDDFMAKTGKFAIRGLPYKLGFLLHGPPGTGKTSLIKAIAQYTKRHIVTINLSKIKTNQELMDAVFDLKFAVDGMDVPVSYSFQTAWTCPCRTRPVVFVMEDIDAASTIVASRKVEHKESKRSSLRRMSSKKLVEKHEAELDDTADAVVMRPKRKADETDDKLNLSSLLNVLDGVVDCPGRIVIMTTNHPEKLDAALIRPGRVNKMLLLSHMNAMQAQHMIEYYCRTVLSPDQSQRVHNVFDSHATSRKPLSPAQVEEFCAEMDDAESVIDALEKHVNLTGDVVFC